MEKSISRIISEFAYNLKFEDLPPEVIHEAKRYLYDSIGCAYGAINTKDVKIMRELLTEIGGSPESTVLITGEKLPAVNTRSSIR